MSRLKNEIFGSHYVCFEEERLWLRASHEIRENTKAMPGNNPTESKLSRNGFFKNELVNLLSVGLINESNHGQMRLTKKVAQEHGSDENKKISLNL